MYKRQRLGFVDGDDAYIVPLNYGYEDKDGELVIYCHGAKDGRKAEDVYKRQCIHLHHLMFWHW